MDDANEFLQTVDRERSCFHYLRRCDMTDRCYLCGSKDALTRDHVPPKNLFRKPLPSNLITVPCCRRCNADHSKIEEQFRVFVSAVFNRSSDGEWIWINKVVGSTFRRSPALKHRFRTNMVNFNVQTPFGPAQIPSLVVDPVPVNRCLIKITRGLLAHFYPQVDQSTLEYDVFQLDQLKVTPDWIRSLEIPFTYDERGDGQFRFLRFLAVDDDARCGVWLYIFYDGMSFVVQHDTPRG